MRPGRLILGLTIMVFWLSAACRATGDPSMVPAIDVGGAEDRTSVPTQLTVAGVETILWGDWHRVPSDPALRATLDRASALDRAGRLEEAIQVLRHGLIYAPHSWILLECRGAHRQRAPAAATCLGPDDPAHL